MRKNLTAEAEKFLEYSKEIKKDFKWEYNMNTQFSALMHVVKNKSYNKESIVHIQDSIKKKTGILSSYRGTHLFLLSSLLKLQFNGGEAKIEELLQIDSKLKKGGFKNNTYRPIAAYTLLTNGGVSKADETIEKAYEIYKEIKSKHVFITGGDDYPLCVLMGGSKENVPEIIEKVENIYEALSSEGFSKGNSLQFLSHILSFSGKDPGEIAEKCREIYDKLKESNLKVAKGYYAVLGIITLISENDPKVIEDLIEISNYLIDSKKLKWVDKGASILAAAVIVSSNYIEENRGVMSVALTVSVETLIMAQLAAMTAAMLAASTAAATSASN